MPRKTDSDQLMGILDEFDDATIRQVIESRGLLLVSASLDVQQHPITLKAACNWQRIGKTNRNYVIANTDGPGKLEIVESQDGKKPPEKATGDNTIGPPLEKGQSTYVDGSDTIRGFLWVHAAEGAVKGYWTLA